MLPLEGTLLEKLRKIEALHEGTTVDGEREAARRAAERIRARLAELRGREQDEELLYSLPVPWKRKLFVALCRRYGLKPYRERGRRYSTVIVRAPKSFQHGTLWPEFSRCPTNSTRTSTTSPTGSFARRSTRTSARRRSNPRPKHFLKQTATERRASLAPTHAPATASTRPSAPITEGLRSSVERRTARPFRSAACTIPSTNAGRDRGSGHASATRPGESNPSTTPGRRSYAEGAVSKSRVQLRKLRLMVANPIWSVDGTRRLLAFGITPLPATPGPHRHVDPDPAKNRSIQPDFRRRKQSSVSTARGRGSGQFRYSHLSILDVHPLRICVVFRIMDQKPTRILCRHGTVSHFENLFGERRL